MAALRHTSHQRTVLTLITFRPSPQRNPSIYNTLSRPVNTRPLTTSSTLLNTSSTSKDASSSASTPYTSIDPLEISHFTRLASTWWDPHGSSRLLHLMNPLRHRFINSCHFASNTPPAPNSLRYLDVGCGGGIFAESAARLGSTRSVLGIDAAKECVRVAEGHRKGDPALVGDDAKLRYVNTSIEELRKHISPVEGQAGEAAEQAQFDIVTVFEVLEHISPPADFLRHVMTHVKPGGWLILSTIARTWTSWFTTKLMAEDVLRIVPRGTHDWSKYVNEDELRRWFESQKGWGDVRSMGVVYVPGVGWREVPGGEKLGNYFLGVRRLG